MVELFYHRSQAFVEGPLTRADECANRRHAGRACGGHCCDTRMIDAADRQHRKRHAATHVRQHLDAGCRLTRFAR